MSDVVSFYEIEHFYRYLDQEPVAKLYPSILNVRRMELKCKSSTKYYCFGIRDDMLSVALGRIAKSVHQFVFFPLEGRYVRRKESFPLKVTYTKYNKSLIKLEMVEGEKYPDGITKKN